ncbi:MAG: hypothetical protein JWR32_3360 [Mycobacterium sp.]|jgi:hypothetical protein|nr:hypothetical protein [Mycobacterium sp.]
MEMFEIFVVRGMRVLAAAGQGPILSYCLSIAFISCSVPRFIKH